MQNKPPSRSDSEETRKRSIRQTFAKKWHDWHMVTGYTTTLEGAHGNGLMVKRSLAEFLGTFALVFFGCGTRAFVGETHNFAGILMVHLTFGLTIAAMVYTLGHISSAQFNPAITLGFAISRRLSWKYILPYWIAEFLGALLASSLHFVLIPDKAIASHYGATIPKVSIIQALVIEIVLTFFLMLASQATATDTRTKRESSGLTVGFVIIIAGLFANSLSGASMNPARSFAPALFAGGSVLTPVWIYFVGPSIGAVLGALAYELLRGGEENAEEAVEEPGGNT